MLTLTPPKTFTTKASIPVPGGESVVIGATFVRMTASELQAFFAPEAIKGRSDIDTLAQVLTDWSGADTPFSRDALERLNNNYYQAVAALLAAFVDELIGSSAPRPK